MKLICRAIRKNTTTNMFIKYLLLMKVSVFIVFLTALQGFANNSSGQYKINLDLKNVSIETVLKK